MKLRAAARDRLQRAELQSAGCRHRGMVAGMVQGGQRDIRVRTARRTTRASAALAVARLAARQEAVWAVCAVVAVVAVVVGKTAEIWRGRTQAGGAAFAARQCLANQLTAGGPRGRLRQGRRWAVGAGDAVCCGRCGRQRRRRKGLTWCGRGRAARPMLGGIGLLRCRPEGTRAGAGAGEEVRQADGEEQDGERRARNALRVASSARRGGSQQMEGGQAPCWPPGRKPSTPAAGRETR